MERWTYLVIAGPDGGAEQLRVVLRRGDDPATWPAAQIGIDGSDRPTDDRSHDYEAPEWKAAQLLDQGMGQGGAARLDQVKGRLRNRAAA
jgi:hypothetical protein